MPLYVYVCAECEIELEELRPADQADWPPVECPICHGLCERGISLFSVGSHARSPQLTFSRPRDPADHAANCPCCRPRR